MSRHIIFVVGILLFSCIDQPVFAQLGFQLDVKKPKPYENRELAAERTDKKKFTLPRRIFQNTYTHYNYVFNASNKLNEVIDRAKEAYKEDYSTLLPFYNYSLDMTAQDSAQLDSVIYKAQTGIVLHDLRNDWIDDLYLLWGAAYYFEKQYDSAYQMFQFINYAFADKEKDGYYKYIGSHMDGNTALSIATKEDRKFPKNLIADPPSRNNAFIWQIRTLTQSEQYTAAGSLIATLRHDPNFPERLKNSLEEAQAYWFYKQEMWDSSAHHLSLALDNAGTGQEKARWEYLIAQMLEKSGKFKEAQSYYTASIGHTTDPILDIYARLNLIHINKEGGDNGNDYIDKNIAELLKMAKRDKYEDYRDVIYFMAAQMEMERNNPVAAEEYVLKGVKYNNNNITSRNQTFLQLADMLFTQKKYKPAFTFYDSLIEDGLTEAVADRVNSRKPILARLVKNLDVVDRQDSLQRIAALSEDERTAYIKKLVRKLRYERGLKDENAVAAKPVNANDIADPFSTPKKGEWYFYNSTLKTQGAAAFKQRWGNRPNVDNWRRLSSVTEILRNNNLSNTRGNPLAAAEVDAIPTFETLLGNLPLTPELLQASNDSIQNALYGTGNIYANDLEDYQSAAATLEELRRRFPQFPNMSDALFQLYYSYTKMGNTAKAAEIKKLLVDKYPTSRYASIITKGVDPTSTRPTEAATKTYEHIYDLFIEGKFDEAEAAKQVADSVYHTNYWEPQLLYIEAVYLVKQRKDSAAIQQLSLLADQNPGTPIAEKALTLVEVLGRRQQIEDELTNLQIEQPAEDTAARVVTAPPAKKQEPEVVKEAPKVTPPPVAVTNPPATNPPVTNPQVNTNPPVTINPPVVPKDTTAVKPKEVVTQKPVNKPVVDTVAKKTLPPAPKNPSSIFTYNTEAPHYAVIILNKVDVVFGNEAKNAFSRYNREKYYNQPLDIQLVDFDTDNKLLLVGNFPNAQAAIDYVQKAKELAPTQIVPWLKGDKYSFSIISDQNLESLKAHPDLNAYKKFLDQNLQVKF